MARPAYDPRKEEIYQISGDMERGVNVKHDLTRNAFAHPQIRYSGRYGDFVLEGDLYRVETGLMLHLICPVCSPKDPVVCSSCYDENPMMWAARMLECMNCRGSGQMPPPPHALWIKNEQKDMDWDPEKGLFVEPFQCTWHMPEANAAGVGRKIEFGLGACPWKVAIERNIARDA